MLNKKVEDAINKQINNEMYSAYLYMSMSLHADTLAFKGAAKWFMVQYHEEMYHAMKMVGYLQEQGVKPRLMAIKEPPADYPSLLSMFEKTLEHEKFVTRSITDILELARSEKDYATEIFIQWYVMEQVEEENNDNEILTKLHLIKESFGGLMYLDKELGKRTAKIPLDYSAGAKE